MASYDLGVRRSATHLAVWPWASYFTSLSLRLLTNKMEMIIKPA